MRGKKVELIVDNVNQGEIIYREDIEKQYIHKDKIRNKLIELSKKLIESNDDRWEKDDDAYYNKIKAQMLVLKELLEGE